MLKKIRRALTGYKVKNTSINGLKIKTIYRGKIPSVDPFANLNGLKSKLICVPEASVISVDFTNCWKERMKCLEGLSPTTITKFEIEGNYYKISRFVFKKNKSPLSLYCFSKNDHVFALFSRVYDYGKSFKEIESLLMSKHKLEKKEATQNFHHIGNGNFELLLDVFGHSQSFLWNDREQLEELLEFIPN